MTQSGVRSTHVTRGARSLLGPRSSAPSRAACEAAAETDGAWRETESLPRRPVGTPARDAPPCLCGTPRRPSEACARDTTKPGDLPVRVQHHAKVSSRSVQGQLKVSSASLRAAQFAQSGGHAVLHMATLQGRWPLGGPAVSRVLCESSPASGAPERPSRGVQPPAPASRRSALPSSSFSSLHKVQEQLGHHQGELGRPAQRPPPRHRHNPTRNAAQHPPPPGTRCTHTRPESAPSSSTRDRHGPSNGAGHESS